MHQDDQWSLGLPWYAASVVRKLYSASVLPASLKAVIRSWYLLPGKRSFRRMSF